MQDVGSGIRTEFERRFTKSGELYLKGKQVFPSGVTHDSRYLEPFPVFVDHALGARKFSVEGHSIIDYWIGHGALLLGHSHPVVVHAVQQQMSRGTHYSACHALEIEWAERIQKLVPSAERVRFTNSGSEATLMALRIARLVTGRDRVVKFVGHFHGWHDLLVPGAYSPYNIDDWSMPGVPSGVVNDLSIIPPNDLDEVERTFARVKPACCILEPTGGHWGLVPIQGEFLHGLRQLCDKHGVILIFDEVITGFRVHPGGAQAYYGVTPDLTSLAKIVAGGLPGGALVGRANLLDALAFGNRHGKKMKHPGTFNGNPLSAAAGCAVLNELSDGNASRHANEMASALRRQLNQLFKRKSVNWFAYGEFSMIHILPNASGLELAGDDGIPSDCDYRRLDVEQPAAFKHAFRTSLLNNGVDWFGLSGMTSIAHTVEEVGQTVNAFDRAIDALRDEKFC